jgi:hypothetical protein
VVGRSRKHREPLRCVPLLAALVVLLGFSSVPFTRSRYLLPALPFLALLAAELLVDRPWTESLVRRFAGLVGAALLVFLLAASVLPLDRSADPGSELSRLAPYVRRYAEPGEEILVGGLSDYTARQLSSWYLDRPQEIVESEEAFLERWRTGGHRVGVLRVREGAQPGAATSVIRGRFRLYLRDAEFEGLDLTRPR